MFLKRQRISLRKGDPVIVYDVSVVIANFVFVYGSWCGSCPAWQGPGESLVHQLSRVPVWNIGTTRRAVRSMSVRVKNVSKIVISDRT